jgi:hypothetical protein
MVDHVCAYSYWSTNFASASRYLLPNLLRTLQAKFIGYPIEL